MLQPQTNYPTVSTRRMYTKSSWKTWDVFDQQIKSQWTGFCCHSPRPCRTVCQAAYFPVSQFCRFLELLDYSVTSSCRQRRQRESTWTVLTQWRIHKADQNYREVLEWNQLHAHPRRTVYEKFQVKTDVFCLAPLHARRWPDHETTCRVENTWSRTDTMETAVRPGLCWWPYSAVAETPAHVTIPLDTSTGGGISVHKNKTKITKGCARRAELEGKSSFICKHPR